MKTMDYHIRPYRQGDEFGIAKLFQVVFQKEFPMARWYWQYRDNPVGIKTIMIAENNMGDIIGHYAVCPVRMKVQEEIRLGSISLDTMVHPEYQGLGLFTALASELYKTLASHGILLTYGFPNKNSFHGFVKKLLWTDFTDHLCIYARILRMDGILEKNITSPLLVSWGRRVSEPMLNIYNAMVIRKVHGGVTCSHGDDIDDGIDALWERWAKSIRIAVVRDKQYLTWRYVHNPCEQYHIINVRNDTELIGCAVLKCEERYGLKIGFIAEMITDPLRPEAVDVLLTETVQYFKAEKMDIANCLALEAMPLIRSLRRNGFMAVPQRFYPQEFHFCFLKHAGAIPTDFVYTAHNWSVSWGDYDVI